MLTKRDLHGVDRDDFWVCRLIWLAAFLALLPITFLAMLTGWRWRPWTPGPDGYKSFFKEADSAANVIVGITYGAS